MKIKEYRKAQNLDEAYHMLQSARNNCIIAGATFLRKTRKQIGTAIDLTDCGLDYICDQEGYVALGASASLRSLETSELIHREFDGMFRAVLKHLIGVQLRSHITIGGHVYSRYGFSDLIPVLLALDAEVCLYRNGVMGLGDFLRLEIEAWKKDILIEIRVPKRGWRGRVQMMRNSYNDYSLFCLAVARTPDDDWRVAAGVRPGRAVLASEAMAYMRGKDLKGEDIRLLAQRIGDEFVLGSNFKAGAAYRRELCRVFARRGLEELTDEG